MMESDLFVAAIDDSDERGVWQRIFKTERGAINFAFRELAKVREGQATVSKGLTGDQFFIIKWEGRSPVFEGGDLESAKFIAKHGGALP